MAVYALPPRVLDELPWLGRLPEEDLVKGVNVGKRLVLRSG
jgi:hypothetical protein